jgi:uracil-DNA glycosylase family 4
MSGKPTSCIGCPLYTKGKGFVPPDGPMSSPITLMGEAPGSSESAQSLPFVGEAGVYLNRALKRLGRERGQYHIRNVLQCQPPKNWLAGAPWEQAAIQHCSVHRHGAWRDDTTYVTMGSIATRTALYEASSITMKGKMDGWHGYVIPSVRVKNSFVIPTYHPAFMLRGNHDLFGAFLWVHKRAMEVASFGNTHNEAGLYIDPDPVAFSVYTESIPDDSTYWLSVDIETATTPLFEGDNEIPVGAITRISFSHNPDQGVTVPWTDPYKFLIREALQKQCAKVFWNANYDVPILNENGFPVIGQIIDGMWAWHMLQSALPKSLGFVTPFYSNVMPWKHTSSDDMPKYAANDPVQTLRCMYGIAKQLKAGDQWDSFVKYSVQLDPILRDMRKAGIGIAEDSATALQQHVEGKRQAYYDLMEQEYPPDLLPYTHILKRPREGFDKITIRQTVLCCDKCGATDVTKSHKC